MRKEVGFPKNWNFFYKIEYVGENIKFFNKKQFISLNVEGTKNNTTVILTRFKDMTNLPKVAFFKETGNVTNDKIIISTVMGML